MTVILGVKTEDRLETAQKIQKILTEYGCFVRTRLGLHNIQENHCPQHALMILEIPVKEKRNAFGTSSSSIQQRKKP